jgi:hypothetical protein
LLLTIVNIKKYKIESRQIINSLSWSYNKTKGLTWLRTGHVCNESFALVLTRSKGAVRRAQKGPVLEPFSGAVRANLPSVALALALSRYASTNYVTVCPVGARAGLP